MNPAETAKLVAIRDLLNEVLGDPSGHASPADLIRARESELTPITPELIEPPWFTEALGELGEREIPGDEDNPRIVEYQGATSLHASDDETPWCSSFVNWCFREANIEGTRSARARSWLEWGQEIAEPELGCVVVFWRGHPHGNKGHVAFYVGPGAQEGTIEVLGGNQGNSVSIKPYPVEHVLSYRMPI